MDRNSCTAIDPIQCEKEIRGIIHNNYHGSYLTTYHKLVPLLRSVVSHGIKHVRVSRIACSEFRMRNSFLKLRLQQVDHYMMDRIVSVWRMYIAVLGMPRQIIRD